MAFGVHRVGGGYGTTTVESMHGRCACCFRLSADCPYYPRERCRTCFRGASVGGGARCRGYDCHGGRRRRRCSSCGQICSTECRRGRGHRHVARRCEACGSSCDQRRQAWPSYSHSCVAGTNKDLEEQVLCKKCETVRRETEQVAARYGRALAGSLVGSWQRYEGFEDDPITHVRVGWTSSQNPPAEMEEELSRRLANVFREDVGHIMNGPRDRTESERDARNRDTFDAWVRTKAEEARAAAILSLTQHRSAWGEDQIDTGRFSEDHWSSRNHTTSYAA
eukprot:TRINITY_DN70876_c0_g1_i1.p1 TRINITY_DN70876_c0_g1~~TRINITY_DN70876_c0_g1_i1.p1  ORF type:complete len:279 (-),score=19.66 TRINITY_DN70876_c0_g1_i1:281-1117(-)